VTHHQQFEVVPRRADWTVHAALFAVALLYAGTFSIAKGLMPRLLTPTSFIALRVMLCAGMLWGLTPWLPGPQKIAREHWKRLIICTLCGIVLNMELFFIGLQLSTPIHSAVIMVTTPIFVLAISLMLRVERVSYGKVGGILLGTAGAIALVLTGTGAKAATQTAALGDLATMANAILYAVYLVKVRPLMRDYHPLVVMKWVFLLGNIITMPLGFQGLIAAPWAKFTQPDWMAVVYVVIGSTFLTYVLNAFALKRATPSLVGAYIYLQPVMATLIAIVLGADTLTWIAVGCGATIFAGLGLVNASRKGAPAPLPRGAPLSTKT